MVDGTKSKFLKKKKKKRAEKQEIRAEIREPQQVFIQRSCSCCGSDRVQAAALREAVLPPVVRTQEAHSSLGGMQLSGTLKCHQQNQASLRYMQISFGLSSSLPVRKYACGLWFHLRLHLFLWLTQLLSSCVWRYGHRLKSAGFSCVRLGLTRVISHTPYTGLIKN